METHSAPSQDASTAAPRPAQDGGARFYVRPVDPETFSTHRISPIRHTFDAHPLMQLPELARLANALASTGQCRFMEPGGTQAAPFTHESRHPDGREIDEVFDRIEEPGSWIALYNVQTHPIYKAFLDEVAVGFRPLAEREQGRILKMDGFIFISAPPSVTPFHIDRENNFWLQIRGRKILNVWDRTDREVVRAADVDRFIVDGSLKNVRMKDGFLERSHEFDVGPGDGVYFPSTSPHSTRDATGLGSAQGTASAFPSAWCSIRTSRGSWPTFTHATSSCGGSACRRAMRASRRSSTAQSTSGAAR